MISKCTALATRLKAHYISKRWGYNHCVKPLARVGLFLLIPYAVCPFIAILTNASDGTLYLIAQTLQLALYVGWLGTAIFFAAAFCIRLIKTAARNC